MGRVFQLSERVRIILKLLQLSKKSELKVSVRLMISAATYMGWSSHNKQSVFKNTNLICPPTDDAKHVPGGAVSRVL